MMPVLQARVSVAILFFVLVVFVRADALAAADKKDENPEYISEMDYLGNNEETQRNNMAFYRYFRQSGYLAVNAYHTNNTTFDEIGTTMLKWLLGLSGSVILFLTSTIVYICRKDIKIPLVRLGNHLREKWADRKAQDRMAILKDVDNDQFSSDTKITVDRIVYRAAPSNTPDSSGGKTLEYTAVPPSSPVRKTPPIPLPPVAENGMLPVAPVVSGEA